jgi:hypothetical protein
MRAFSDDPSTVANGTAWRSDLWTTSQAGSGSGTIDIQGGVLRLRTGTTANDVARAISKMRNIVNAEMVCSVFPQNPLAAQSIGFMLRASGDWASGAVNSTTGIYFELLPFNTQYNVYYLSGGTQNLIAGPVSHTFTAGNQTTVRLRCEGNVISTKVWDSSSSSYFDYLWNEPGAWDTQTKDDHTVGVGGTFQVSEGNNGVAAARTVFLGPVWVNDLDQSIAGRIRGPRALR